MGVLGLRVDVLGLRVDAGGPVARRDGGKSAACRLAALAAEELVDQRCHVDGCFLLRVVPGIATHRDFGVRLPRISSRKPCSTELFRYA